MAASACQKVEIAIQVGLAAVYTVTGAKSMAVLEDLSKDEDSGASITKYTFVFGAVQLLLSQIPDFAHLWWVSIVGAAMSLGYSLLSGALAIAAAQARDGGADYGKRGSGAEFWRGVFTSLGAITFAYGGHSVLLEIQATLRVPPSAKVSMMKGVAPFCASTRFEKREKEGLHKTKVSCLLHHFDSDCATAFMLRIAMPSPVIKATMVR